MIRNRLQGMAIVCAMVLMATAATRAQDAKPGPEFRTSLGYTAFVDESFLHHFAVGSSFRIPLTSKLGIEPEFLYLYESASDQDIVLLGNLSWHITRMRRATPYLVIGVGMLAHRGITGRGPFWGRAPFVSGGAGVKIRVGDRWTISPEFRMGVETHMRFTVGIGYLLGK